MPTETIGPYEVVIRYHEHVLSGSHVGWSLLRIEDNGTKRETPLTAEPVDIGQGKGFPLSDLLEKIHVDALVAVAAKDIEIAETIQSNEAIIATVRKEKEAALATAEAEKTALAEAKDAEIAAAASEIAAKETALAIKTAEIAAEKSAREAKEQEAAQLIKEIEEKAAALALKDEELTAQSQVVELAAQIETCYAQLADLPAEDERRADLRDEIAFLKLPEKEKKTMAIQVEIERLEAEKESLK